MRRAGLLLLLAVLCGGCDWPYTDQIATTQAETAQIRERMKELEASVPVIEERKKRIRQLDAEITELKREIAELEARR